MNHTIEYPELEGTVRIIESNSWMPAQDTTKNHTTCLSVVQTLLDLSQTWCCAIPWGAPSHAPPGCALLFSSQLLLVKISFWVLLCFESTHLWCFHALNICNAHKTQFFAHISTDQTPLPLSYLSNAWMHSITHHKLAYICPYFRSNFIKTFQVAENISL